MVTVIVETPAGTVHCWVVPAVPKLTVQVVASHDGVGSADAGAAWITPVASTLERCGDDQYGERATTGPVIGNDNVHLRLSFEQRSIRHP